MIFKERYGLTMLKEKIKIEIILFKEQLDRLAILVRK